MMKYQRWVLGVLGWIGVCVAWEAYHLTGQTVIIPSVFAILRAIWELILSGTIFKHVGFSIGNAFLGMVAAACVGTGLAIAVLRFQWFRQMVLPVTEGLRSISSIPLFPMILMIFGIGFMSKVFVIFWVAWPPVLLAILQGVSRVPDELRGAASLDGAGAWAVLWYIELPMAVPEWVVGLRIGFGSAWVALIAAEMLGTSRGLGYLTLTYSQTFQFARMFAVVGCIGGIGFLVNMLCLRIQERLQDEEDSRIFRGRGNHHGSHSLNGRIHRGGRASGLEIRKLQSI